MREPVFDLRQKAAAEFTGTGFLVGTVVGSGIMAERLSDDNVALALLANGIATGAILAVLIIMLAPISGAHLNPTVTLMFFWPERLDPFDTLFYVGAQCIGDPIGLTLAARTIGV